MSQTEIFKVDTPVLVIVGPTASGKSTLGVQMAKKYNGEIISADSRAIYKYINIASAKPTLQDQGGVKHWGVDIVGPEHFKTSTSALAAPFTVADFKHYAEDKIMEIAQRGKLPIVVGGSGLYIDALIYDYNFDGILPNSQYLKKRKIYHQMTSSQLQDYCKNNNIKLPSNFNNKRYLVRAIEKFVLDDSGLNDRKSINLHYKVVGITTKNELLDTKITQRVDQMLADGLIDEYKNISKIYHKNSEVLRTNAYIVIKKYLNNEIKEEDLRWELIRRDKKLVKKQKTWFKRNEQIIWTDLENAPAKIAKILSL